VFQSFRHVSLHKLMCTGAPIIVHKIIGKSLKKECTDFLKTIDKYAIPDCSASEPPSGIWCFIALRRRHEYCSVNFLMEQFKSYLLSKNFANEKTAGFYVSWVDRFYKSNKKNLGDPVTDAEKELFLKNL
jgi:hypothetical protein